jgi:hypothetical protein
VSVLVSLVSLTVIYLATLRRCSPTTRESVKHLGSLWVGGDKGLRRAQLEGP